MTSSPVICICGGGSLGLVCASVFVSQGLQVNILTGHPDNWNRNIESIDNNGKLYKGVLNRVSDIPDSVIPNADIILLCVPGYLIQKTLIDIKPFLKRESIVGSIVSSTGFFIFAHEIFGDKAPLFGFQRVPFISRSKEYGKIGQLLGYKKSLNVAIENYEDSFTETLSKIFITPVNRLANFYEASLTNSNPILHTGRLFSMWKDYRIGMTYDTCPLFYHDWTDDASETLLAMDREFMALLKQLNIRQGVIPSLLEYYEVSDAKSLTAKIISIDAFKDIVSPMKKTETGWTPDFSSRYFTEDFPYGLGIIKELAEKHKVHIPTISKVYNWGITKLL